MQFAMQSRSVFVNLGWVSETKRATISGLEKTEFQEKRDVKKVNAMRVPQTL
jgi:hypothetical protein